MPDTRLSTESLLAEYETYGTPKESWLIGGEFERHLLTEDGMPLPYEGEPGIRWLLEKLAATGEWKPYREEGHLIALTRPMSSVTLEPGGQFELSGAPFVHIADLEAEAQAFTAEVGQCLAGTGVRQVALGHTPYARIEDIAWMPKGRYVIMRKALAERGALAHNMMKGTCAVQASFDFADEADCARKVRIGMQLGPLTTAMFANSPIVAGRDTGYASFRGHVWTQTDPDRTGFPQAAVDFSYQAWLDYLLDVPLLFRMQNGKWLPGGGQSFRRWMEHGIDGTFPTRDDWELHLTSVFPEVRVKKKIEIRGADAVSFDLAMAFGALFKGLFYCNKTLAQTLDVAARFSEIGTRDERFAVACRDGLAGELGGRRLADWAAEVVQAADEGLGRCDPEDRHYLAPLIRLVEGGESPATAVRANFAKDPRPEAFLDTCLFE
ncbi:MAG: glutamate--cysteine ligase [Deltaproteobacteria bacterium]|nr:MAG: glutamate--cysteine ligase [Deltaproteobacteria bacterium]